MHMADALISPAVGGTAWAAAAGLIGYSSRKLKNEMDDRQIPLMAVMGAFIFAAQMINFSIPATGSSGHLGGGLLLAILLGPYAGFLTIASVLVIQALFFADGGLLALGCNVVNLGFFSCFIAYPLIYRKIADDQSRKSTVVIGALISAVVALQLGSLGVVTQTYLSGVSELPYRTFALMMQPIHLAIGIVEGVVTAAVVLFVLKARPEILTGASEKSCRDGLFSLRTLGLVFLFAALLIGVGLSWFASSHPDGLEWSIFKVAGVEELNQPESALHGSLDIIQQKTAILPDYSLKNEAGGDVESPASSLANHWGTSLSSLVGCFLTFLLAGAVWKLASRRRVSV